MEFSEAYPAGTLSPVPLCGLNLRIEVEPNVLGGLSAIRKLSRNGLVGSLPQIASHLDVLRGYLKMGRQHFGRQLSGEPFLADGHEDS